jgi:hypothetical protein
VDLSSGARKIFIDVAVVTLAKGSDRFCFCGKLSAKAISIQRTAISIRKLAQGAKPSTSFMLKADG